MIEGSLIKHLQEEAETGMKNRILLININLSASIIYRDKIETTGHYLIDEISELTSLDYLSDTNQPDLIVINIESTSNYNGFQLAKVVKMEFDGSIFIIYNDKEKDLGKWALELNPVGIETFIAENIKIKLVA